MSLRAIHILFIIASTALAVGFGFWARAYYPAMSVASFVSGVLLVVYLFWFVKKSRTLNKA